MRWAGAVLASALFLAAPRAARPQDAEPALTSAPFDLSLFRDGETRRMRARYDGWTAVCDEIMRLHRRYCSLSASVLDAAGGVVARLDVSTDDAGRPAALMHLPHGTLLDRPVTVGSARAGRGAVPRALRVIRCDAADCAAVWALDAADFAALEHDGLALAYRRTARLGVPSALLKGSDAEAVAGRVPAAGFADAIAATLRAGPLTEAAGDGLGLRR